MVLTFNGGSIVMPAEPAKPLENEVSLPWGKAIEKSYEAFDSASGTTLLVATFEFKNPRKILNKAGLLKVREYFLRHRGCTAKTLPINDLQDASGKIWPQTVFGGVCKAPVEFQIAVLIVDNKLFWFEAYRNIFQNPKAKKMTLDEALRRFVAEFKPFGEK